MKTLNDFKNARIENPKFITGGVTIYCKDSAGSNLGTATTTSNSAATRKQDCIDAGHSGTTMTAGPRAPAQQ